MTHVPLHPRASRRLSRRLTSVLALALTVALISAGVAVADELQADGDGLVPVEHDENPQTLAIGNVCQNEQASGTVLLAIRRTGSGNNVYANNAAITVSAGAPTGAATVSSLFTDNAIGLPGNWGAVSNNTISSDIATSVVTVNAGASTGAKSAQIVYSAAGARASGQPTPTLTRTATVTINWNVVVCADTTPPVLSGVPSDMTVEGNTTGGANVSWAAPTATDNVDPSPTVGCSPASGSFFALGGPHTVTCTATDASGNSASASFQVTVVDTTAPSLSVPSNMTVEGNTTGGANVSWTAPTATDIVDPSPVVGCSPSSGSFFALGGPHAVSCSATDASGNSASAGFQVTVVDTTAPSLSVPSSMMVEGNTTGGANVSWAAPTATDVVDPSPVVGCSPSSGSFFALGGPHAVSCSATDASGNSASGGFQVTVRDTVAPSLSVPSNMTVEGNTTSGANVSWAAPTATDVVDPAPVVSCVPSSGSFFALGGPHAVSCSATDASGNSASGGFQVTVRDTVAPTLSGMPGNISAVATGGGQAVVSWTNPTATDVVDPAPSVSCSPASGSSFPVGTTPVTCTATDASGNVRSASFQVSVVYSWSGFLRPVDNLPTVNRVKAGSAVPVKFSLSGNQGLNIFMAGSPTSQAVSCNNSAPVDPVEETVTAGSSSLSYDPTNDQYNYVWKTDKGWANQCRQLTLRLADGSTQTAVFHFTR